MALYELTNDYKVLYEQLDNCTTDEEFECWFDTFQAVEMEWEDKIKMLAKYSNSLMSEADAIKENARIQTDRAKAKENKAKGIKNYCLSQMEIMNRKKIEDADIVISVRKGANSVVIADEDIAIQWCENNAPDCVRTKRDLSKTSLKEYLSNGVDVPGAYMESKPSIIIK